MTEYLFKLKKNDKTVGYMKIGNKIWWKINRCWIEIDPQEGCSEFFEDDNGWDTIYPFITKGKNGDDVFAGDKIKGVISDISSKVLIGRIVPNETPPNKYGIRGCWMFKYNFLRKEYLAPAADLQDIELIKDEEK